MVQHLFIYGTRANLFNMLLAGTFPEVELVSAHEKIPSTKMLKKQ